MIGELHHSGYFSYCKYNNLQQWFTTTSTNQTIEFYDGDNLRQLNSLMIESETTDLYIRILPSDYILYVPANDVRTYEFTKVSKIQVMGASGIKFRFSGCYY
jgi:hypothetical protein